MTGPGRIGAVGSAFTSVTPQNGSVANEADTKNTAASVAEAQARAAGVAAGILSQAPALPQPPSTAPAAAAAAAAAPQPAQQQKSPAQIAQEKRLELFNRMVSEDTSTKEMAAFFAGLQKPEDRDYFIQMFGLCLEKNFLAQFKDPLILPKLLNKTAALFEHMTIQEQFFFVTILNLGKNGPPCLGKISVNWATQILPRLPQDKRVLFVPWLAHIFEDYFPFLMSAYVETNVERSEFGCFLRHDKPYIFERQREDTTDYARIWTLRRAAQAAEEAGETIPKPPEFPADPIYAEAFESFNKGMAAEPKSPDRIKAFFWFFNNLPILKKNPGKFPYFVRAFYLHATLDQQIMLMHYLRRPSHAGCIQAIIDVWLGQVLPYLPDDQRYLFLPNGFDTSRLEPTTYEVNRIPVGTLLIYKDKNKERYNPAREGQNMARGAQQPPVAQTEEEIHADAIRRAEEEIKRKEALKQETVRKTNAELSAYLVLDWADDAGVRSVDTPGVALAKGLDPATLKASLDAYPDAIGSIAILFAIKILEIHKEKPDVAKGCIQAFAAKARDEDLYSVIRYLQFLDKDCAQFVVNEACAVRKSIVVPYLLGRIEVKLFDIPEKTAVVKAVGTFTDRARYTWQ